MTKDRLKELRRDKKMTQAQVAKLLSITTRNYQRLEITDDIPPSRHLVVLADYYDVSVDYILCRTDKKEVNR